MAQATQFVSNYQSTIRTLLNAIEDLRNLDEGEYTCAGADRVVAPHFVDTNGDARTDLDYTAAEIASAIGSVRALDAWLASEYHYTNLYKVAGRR